MEYGKTGIIIWCGVFKGSLGIVLVGLLVGMFNAFNVIDGFWTQKAKGTSRTKSRNSWYELIVHCISIIFNSSLFALLTLKEAAIVLLETSSLPSLVCLKPAHCRGEAWQKPKKSSCWFWWMSLRMSQRSERTHLGAHQTHCQRENSDKSVSTAVLPGNIVTRAAGWGQRVDRRKWLVWRVHGLFKSDPKVPLNHWPQTAELSRGTVCHQLITNVIIWRQARATLALMSSDRINIKTALLISI